MRIDITPPRLTISPFFRDSALATPLGYSSGHHFHVLNNWPKAYVRNLIQLSSSECIFEHAKEFVIERLAFAGYPQVLLEEIRMISFVKAQWKCIGSKNTQSESRDFSTDLWVTLPFHPSFLALGSTLARINSDVRLQSLLADSFDGQKPVLRIAWQRFYRTLASRLNSMC